jgi:hypothetical protein
MLFRDEYAAPPHIPHLSIPIKGKPVEIVSSAKACQKGHNYVRIRRGAKSGKVIFVTTM